jgi:hypothetical protein
MSIQHPQVIRSMRLLLAQGTQGYTPIYLGSYSLCSSVVLSTCIYLDVFHCAIRPFYFVAKCDQAVFMWIRSFFTC